MKLSEIIETITVDDMKQYDCSEMLEYFNLYDIHWDKMWQQDRLKYVTIGRHYCTDQAVGIDLIFFDHEFVAISSKTARKSEIHFEFKSVEIGKEVFEFLKTFVIYQKPYFYIVDFDADIGDGYKIDYSIQVIDGVLKYIPTGELVTVGRQHYNNDIDSWYSIEATFPNGDVKAVSMKDVFLPWGKY